MLSDWNELFERLPEHKKEHYTELKHLALSIETFPRKNKDAINVQPEHLDFYILRLFMLADSFIAGTFDFNDYEVFLESLKKKVKDHPISLYYASTFLHYKDMITGNWHKKRVLGPPQAEFFGA
jgi:hypothetical protein